MSHVVAKGSSVSILHILRDLAGTGVMTGQAANISYLITDPTGSTASTGMTWTEPNADGFYLGAKEYDVLGTWHVEIDDSAIALSNGGKHDYYVQCVQEASGITPTGTFLTSLANFKEHIDEDSSANDTYYTNLIARATQRIERLVGRPLVSATYTERYDGGNPTLELRKGPLTSVTYVADVTYDSVGVATTSAIDAGQYIPYGLAADGWMLPGSVQACAGRWTSGQKNYEVQYVGGFVTVPYDLENACLELAVWIWNNRLDAGRNTRDHGDGAVSFRSPAELERKLRRELAHYVDMRAS